MTRSVTSEKSIGTRMFFILRRRLAHSSTANPRINPAPSPETVVDETHVAAMSDHDVVEHADADEVSDLAQPPGDLDVLAARRRVAARMVVDEDHRSRRFADHRQVDVARVDDARGQRALRDADLLDLAVLV